MKEVAEAHDKKYSKIPETKPALQLPLQTESISLPEKTNWI